MGRGLTENTRKFIIWKAYYEKVLQYLSKAGKYGNTC